MLLQYKFTAIKYVLKSTLLIFYYNHLDLNKNKLMIDNENCLWYNKKLINFYNADDKVLIKGFK